MYYKFRREILNLRGLKIFRFRANRRVLDVGIVDNSFIDSHIVRARLEIKCARLIDESSNFVFQKSFEIKK